MKEKSAGEDSTQRNKSAKKQVTKENANRDDEDERSVEFSIYLTYYTSVFLNIMKSSRWRETHEILLYCNRDRNVKMREILPCVRPVGMNPYSVPKKV